MLLLIFVQTIVFYTVWILVSHHTKKKINRINEVRNFFLNVIDMCYEYNMRNIVEVTESADESAYEWVLSSIPSFDTLIKNNRVLDIAVFLHPKKYLRLITETRNTDNVQIALDKINAI